MYNIVIVYKFYDFVDNIIIINNGNYLIVIIKVMSDLIKK